jgi:DsbC/DsbD-like thiol-disulfide interchange protein
MKTTTRQFISVAIAAATIALPALPSSAEMGDWLDADVVNVRLVASARGDLPPVAALEIELAPGWKTYWRTPGEGGLPPILDFSQSLNVAGVEVSFPPPHRFNDGYSITNVYEGRVVFPIELTPEVVASPVTLHLQFDLGVCETICIPMQLETTLTFAPNQTDAGAIAIFDEGRSLLPAAPIPGEFEIVDFELVRKDGPSSYFEVTAIVPQSFGSELFVEVTEAWWPTAPQQSTRDGNLVTFAFSFERPDATAPLSGTPFTFTLVSAGAAIEQTIALP